ncbi:MAG TPA: hypothetical protein VGU20_07065 [Stellaceae bacterium]|nr:hypothetical protein [Stellaceae bacterium]
MGLAKRARLSAVLTAPGDLPPAADLSTIRIVRRDKGPASVIALADSRPASDGSAKPGGDGMFYKKGNATASTFRPAYWTYEPDPSQVAGPVASLEQQLDARRRSNSPSTPPIEAKPEEKPLASLDAAPTIRRLAPLAEPLPPVPDPPAAPRAFQEPAELDSAAVEALLRPLPDAAAMPAEAKPTPAAVEAPLSTPAAELTLPPLTPSEIREEPAVLPVDLAPPDDPPLAFPVASPPTVEVPVVASPPPSPPISASVAVESPAPATPPAAAPEAERSRPSAAPTRKRPAREAAKPAEPESAEFDALGAAIDSVLASRWYGSERSGFTATRVLRSDIAPVTPSGLIAELATVRKDPEPLRAPGRGRRGRFIAALSLVFALAFGGALLWRTGHGSMLPTRLLPALLGAASLPEITLALADIHPAAPERS